LGQDITEINGHVKYKICLPRSWAEALAFLLHKPDQGFSQHCSHLHSAFAYLHSRPPILCSKESLGRLGQ